MRKILFSILIVVAIMVCGYGILAYVVGNALTYYKKDPPDSGWYEFKARMADPAVPLFEELLKELDSPSVGDRVYAILKIRDMGEQASSSAPKLVLLFADDTGSIGEGAEHCFKCENVEERYEVSRLAKETLMALGVRAIPALVDYLNIPYDSPEKDFGALFLKKGRIDDVLGEILNGEDIYEYVLAKLENQPDESLWINIAGLLGYRASPALTSEQKKRYFSFLMGILQESKSETARSAAAFNLSLVGGDEAIGPLIGALNDESRDVRFHAARALSHLDREEALETLLKEVTDRISPYRKDAAYHLQFFCSSAQVLKTLKDVAGESVFSPPPDVRAAQDAYRSCVSQIKNRKERRIGYQEQR